MDSTPDESDIPAIVKSLISLNTDERRSEIAKFDAAVRDQVEQFLGAADQIRILSRQQKCDVSPDFNVLAAMGETGSKSALISTDGEPPVSEMLVQQSESHSVRNACIDSAGSSAELKSEWDPRYEIIEEIARGGMGSVLRARDRVFDRELAIKTVLPSKNLNSDYVERFIREARIAGRLQHPGIVPVYEFGTLEDGRHYITMKLVSGETLATLLDQRSSPNDDPGRYLQIFEQVCHAIAYANSSGVLHRDLKPLNIMVGQYGEIQVMDWGLARSSANQNDPVDGIESESPGPWMSSEAFADSRSGLQTRAGSVLGTPSYMAPEQARGQTDLYDQRTDVFGLGAILCEILTGKPPYVHQSAKEVLRLAAEADQTECHGRLASTHIDSGLAELCRQCLAPDRRFRISSAAEVARQIREHQTSVQQKLEQERHGRFEAQVRAEEVRKRFRMTQVLMVTLLSLVLVAGSTSLWYFREKAEKLQSALLADEKAHGEINLQLAEAHALRTARQWEPAALRLKQAKRLATGMVQPGQVMTEIDQASRDLRIVREFESIRIRKRSTFGGEGFNVDFSNGPDGAYAVAFRAYGLELTGPHDSYECAASIRKSSIRQEIVDGIDDWVGHETDENLVSQLLHVARQADPDPVMDQLRDPLVRKDPDKLLQLSQSIDPALLSSSALINFSRLVQVHNPEAAIQFLRRAAHSHTDDFWLNQRLGRYTGETRWLQAAVALRPEHPVAHNALGVVLHRAGHIDDAETHFRRAIELDPGFSWPYGGLAALMAERGKDDDAETLYRQAIQADSTCHSHYLGLAWLFSKTGRESEAESALREGINATSASVHLLSALSVDLIRQRQIVESVSLAKAVASAHDALPDELYSAACVFSIAAATDASQLTETHHGTPSNLIDAAFKSLDAALKVGWSDIDTIKTDPDLEALRSDPRFELILQKIQQTANP